MSVAEHRRLSLPTSPLERGRCPGCCDKLATPLARQCFNCGLDWHNPHQPVKRIESTPGEVKMPRRRGFLGWFLPLLVLWCVTQLFVLFLIVTLVRLPAAALVAVFIGGPIMAFVIPENAALENRGAPQGASFSLPLWRWLVLATLAVACHLFPAQLPVVAVSVFGLTVISALWRDAGQPRKEPLNETLRRRYYAALLPYGIFFIALLQAPQVAIAAVVTTFCFAEFLALLLSLAQWLPRRRLASR